MISKDEQLNEKNSLKYISLNSSKIFQLKVNKNIINSISFKVKW